MCKEIRDTSAHSNSDKNKKTDVMNIKLEENEIDMIHVNAECDNNVTMKKAKKAENQEEAKLKEEVAVESCCYCHDRTEF